MVTAASLLMQYPGSLSVTVPGGLPFGVSLTEGASSIDQVLTFDSLGPVWGQGIYPKAQEFMTGRWTIFIHCFS